uniref:Uncharacterized protein n=1 Tax=Vitis vinifera TaxID=29760 RepID=F6I3R5_VITVI
MRIIPSLALLMKSDEVIDRFFAAQAMASLVCNGSRGINLTIANSGAVAELITLIGYIESDMPNLVALSEEFCLVRKPDQVVLENLFEIEDIRVGSTARKSMPLLVDLLRPIPDRPGAPPIAVQLLTRIADGSDTNKLIMAEAGALDVLTKYLSLSPQDSSEAIVSELLRILFSNPDLLRYKASISSLNQLIAVLHLGSRNARFSVADALEALSSKSTRAKKAVVDADGVPVLIGAIVAPSKEFMQGECGQALQGHATRALANICGGMSALIMYLGELPQSPRLASPVANIIGALAYSLMVFEQQSVIEEEPFDATQIEDILVMPLKPSEHGL